MQRPKDISLPDRFMASLAAAVSVGATAAVLSLMAGCFFGPRAVNYGPVQSAAGITAHFSVGSELPVTGELLTVDSSSFLVRREDGQIARVYESETLDARFEVVKVRLPKHAPLNAERREQLRLHSRHPQGVSPSMLARYLEASGQSAVIEYGRIDGTGAGASAHESHPRRVQSTDLVSDGEAGRQPAAQTSRLLDRESDEQPRHLEEALQQIREAAAPFADINAAIAAGYRLVGADMPSMGEHWVSPRAAMFGDLDRDKPAALTYLRTDSGRRLTGVAYITPHLPGEPPPPPPVPGATWHYHGASIDEETLRDSPADTPSGAATGSEDHAHGTPTDPGLAMMHVWLFVDNPDGVLAADNWALPYVRLDLAVPAVVHPDAARALSLAAGGVDFYTSVAARLSRMDAADRAIVRRNLESARADVERLVADLRAARTSNEQDSAAHRHLESVWRDAWEKITRELPPRYAETLARLG